MPVIALTREDFLPQTWIKDEEQTHKDSQKHVDIQKTSKELISDKVDECIEIASKEGRSPLEIIKEGFKYGQESEFYNHIKGYQNRTWGLIYNLAEAMMGYRDSLPDGSEKDAVESILKDLNVLWKETRNQNAREGLLTKLTKWLEAPPSPDHLEQVMKMLANSYFVVKGLSIKLASLGSFEKRIAGAAGVNVSEMEKTVNDTLIPLIVSKYTKAKLTQAFTKNPDDAWSIIEKNKADTISILSTNPDLALQLIEKGDETTKAFISGDETIVTALLNANKNNIMKLLPFNSETIDQIFKNNTQCRNSFAKELSKDIDFANNLIHFLKEKKIRDVIKPFLEADSNLASNLQNRQSQDSEMYDYLKNYVRLSESHVTMVNKLGGELESSLKERTKKIPSPKDDAAKKKALQEKCARLQVLDKVLAKNGDDNLVNAFWAEYNTQEKIDTLKNDLSSLSEVDKTNLQRHFKSVFFLTSTGFLGNAVTTATSAFSWLQTTVNPSITGGVPRLAGLLKEAVNNALSNAQESLSKETEELMSITTLEGDTTTDRLNNIANTLKGKTRAEKVDALKSKLTTLVNNLPSVDELSLDNLKSSQENYFLTSEDNKGAVIDQVLKDFDAAIEVVKVHRQMISILVQVEENIESLNKAGVDVGPLRKAFDNRVDKTFKKAKTLYYNISESTTTKDKLSSMEKTLGDAEGDLEEMKNKHKNINSIDTARAYITDRKKTWGHFFMKIFSSSYRNMYVRLEKAVEKYDAHELNEEAAVEEIRNAVKAPDYQSDEFSKLKKQVIQESKEEFEEQDNKSLGTSSRSN